MKSLFGVCEVFGLKNVFLLGKGKVGTTFHLVFLKYAQSSQMQNGMEIEGEKIFCSRHYISLEVNYVCPSTFWHSILALDAYLAPLFLRENGKKKDFLQRVMSKTFGHQDRFSKDILFLSGFKTSQVKN